MLLCPLCHSLNCIRTQKIIQKFLLLCAALICACILLFCRFQLPCGILCVLFGSVHGLCTGLHLLLGGDVLRVHRRAGMRQCAADGTRCAVRKRLGKARRTAEIVERLHLAQPCLGFRQLLRGVLHSLLRLFLPRAELRFLCSQRSDAGCGALTAFQAILFVLKRLLACQYLFKCGNALLILLAFSCQLFNGICSRLFFLFEIICVRAQLLCRCAAVPKFLCTLRIV